MQNINVMLYENLPRLGVLLGGVHGVREAPIRHPVGVHHVLPSVVHIMGPLGSHPGPGGPRALAMQGPPERVPGALARLDVRVGGGVVGLEALPGLAARVADVAHLIAAQRPVPVEAGGADALVVVGEVRQHPARHICHGLHQALESFIFHSPAQLLS